MLTHIRIVCPACQETGKVRATYLGRKIRCKHCGSTFRVPFNEEGASTSASTASTELQASRTEVERLRTELESARAVVEGARAEWEHRLAEALYRVADLGEALRGACEERAALEAERRALQANWDEEREALGGQVEQRVRMAEERAEAEQQAWREQAEAALLRSETEREVLEGTLDRLRDEIASMRGEREVTRTRIESLTREREETTTSHDQLKVAFQEREEASQARILQLDHALQQAIQKKDAERQRGDELAGEVNVLRADREQQQQDREGERQQALQLLATLQQDLKAQQRWAEQTAADRRHIEGGEAPEGERDGLRQELNALRGEREATRTLIESLIREREQLTTFRNQLKASFQERETAYESKLTQLGQALQQANRENATIRQRGNELVGQVRELRDQLGRQPLIGHGERGRAFSSDVSREQGPTINPPVERGLQFAIAHTDVALSQLGSFRVPRK